MKILFLSHMLAGGGSEKVLANLSVFLPDEHEKVIVLFEDKVGYEYFGKIIVLNEHAQDNIFKKFLTFIKRFIKFKKVIQQERPDIVISFLEGPNILNLFTPGKHKKILTIHNYLNFEQHLKNNLIYKTIKRIIRIFYNKADSIIAVSQGIKKELLEQYGIESSKVNVIYNPIDINDIQKKSQEEVNTPLFIDAIKEDLQIIITVGRLSVEKGHKFLLNAFNKIKNKTNIKLFIVGQGHLEAEIKEFINNLGLTDRVYLLGWQDNPYKYLKAADIFVLSSLWEGFPVILEEAMALGKPIISFDCPHGPREILDNGKYGILVPEQDTDKLAEEILKLINNKALQDELSKKSMERAKDFDKDIIIKQYVDLLEKLLVSG